MGRPGVPVHVQVSLTGIVCWRVIGIGHEALFCQVVG